MTISYSEAKTIIRNHYSLLWKRRLGVESGHDPIPQLQRHQQTILFRLRTGHCRFLSHLYRIKVSPTNECPCKTGTQTPQHILQDCPTFRTLRCHFWPEGTDMRQKLWGSHKDLERTAEYIRATELEIWLHDQTKLERWRRRRRSKVKSFKNYEPRKRDLCKLDHVSFQGEVSHRGMNNKTTMVG